MGESRDRFGIGHCQAHHRRTRRQDLGGEHGRKWFDLSFYIAGGRIESASGIGALPTPLAFAPEEESSSLAPTSIFGRVKQSVNLSPCALLLNMTLHIMEVM